MDKGQFDEIIKTLKSKEETLRRLAEENDLQDPIPNQTFDNFIISNNVNVTYILWLRTLMDTISEIIENLIDVCKILDEEIEINED